MASPESDNSEDILICNQSQCTKDEDKDSLTCGKCKRSVHYRCTMLPAYQIQLILNKRGPNKYVCQNCVDVPEDLLQLVPIKQRSHPSLKTEKEIERLRRDNDALNAIIQQNILDLEKKNKMIEIKVNDLKQLKEKLDDSPGLHTLEYVEEKFERQLENFKETMENLIKTECKSLTEKSYADAARSGSNVESTTSDTVNIKEAIREAWREEDFAEQDRLRRAKNVIIHGLPEQPTKDDNAWAADLVNDTQAPVNIKRVIRLGKAADPKKHPLLISLKTEEERVKLLGNLSALKDLDRYKGISVTEDLTPEERKVHKELSIEANERNTVENLTNEIWRVRGSSKNGFYLKKVKLVSKKNSINNDSNKINQDRQSKKVTFTANR